MTVGPITMESGSTHAEAFTVTTASRPDNTTTSNNSNSTTDGDRIYYFALIVIGCFGTLSNGFAILVIQKFTQMTKKMAGAFILSQCWTDVLCSFLLACNYTVFAFYGFDLPFRDNTLNEVYCRMFLTEWLQWGLTISSTWNLVGVNFERYLSVVWPFLHLKLSTGHFARPLIISAWAVGIGYKLVFSQLGTHVENHQCMAWAFGNHDIAAKVYGSTVSLVTYFIPLALILYFYSHMIWIVTKKTMAAIPQTNLFKTLTLVTLGFVICWTPAPVCFALPLSWFPRYVHSERRATFLYFLRNAFTERLHKSVHLHHQLHRFQKGCDYACSTYQRMQVMN